MKKKVVYQVTRHKIEMVEVETPEQEELIKQLNRDFERMDKSDKTYRARCSSLDELYATEGFEPQDNSSSPEEIFVENCRQQSLRKVFAQALATLTERQRQIVTMVFYDGLSQRESACVLGISEAAVAVTLKRALANIKKYLRNFAKP